MSSSNDLATEAMSHESLEKILKAMAGLKFGSVEITVHEGRMVQIERKEKVRLNINSHEPPIKNNV